MQLSIRIVPLSFRIAFCTAIGSPLDPVALLPSVSAPARLLRVNHLPDDKELHACPPDRKNGLEPNLLQP